MFCVTFSRKDSGFCIYHLFLWSYSNFLRNQWISLPTQSCLFLYSFCAIIICSFRVFHISVSDSKSPQVSRILLSILAVFNNAVVWMVSTRLPTSKSFKNPLVTVPKAPITIGTIVTFMFHSFFNSLARSRYISFFSHSFSFNLCSAGTAKSTILQILFFFLLIIIIMIIILIIIIIIIH